MATEITVQQALKAHDSVLKVIGRNDMFALTFEQYQRLIEQVVNGTSPWDAYATVTEEG